MTVSKIIEEIEKLSPAEQAEVTRYVYNLDAKRQLSGTDLGALAERLKQTDDPLEAILVREAILRGFYGKEPLA